MNKGSLRRAVEKAIAEFIRRRRKGEPEQPQDPYANVTAPKKPRPHQVSAAAVLDLPDE
jgi:hypothetical protein